VHRHLRRGDLVEQRDELRIGHDDPTRIDLQHQAHGTESVGITNRVGDDVDHHRVEQAVDLEHRDEPGARGVTRIGCAVHRGVVDGGAVGRALGLGGRRDGRRRQDDDRGEHEGQAGEGGPGDDRPAVPAR
jgi:hypothetical protein